MKPLILKNMANQENEESYKCSLATFFIDNPMVILKIEGTVVFDPNKEDTHLQVDCCISVSHSLNGKSPSDILYSFSIPDNFGILDGDELEDFINQSMLQYQIEICKYYMERNLLSATEILKFVNWDKQTLLKPEQPDCYHHGYLHILYWATLKVGEQIRNRVTALTKVDSK